MKQQLVCGFLFSTDQKRLAVIDKKRPEFLDGKTLPPGGKIEDGETPLQAVIREFQEETGVQINGWQQFVVLETPDVEVYCFMHFSSIRLRKIKTVTDEKVYVVDVNNLPATMIPNARWMITMALSFSQGEHAGSFAVQEVYA